MICPKCKEDGLESFVFEGSSTIALMGCFVYYDKEGNRHIHDPNIITTHYTCSNGHSWVEQTKNKCWCGE